MITMIHVGRTWTKLSIRRRRWRGHKFAGIQHDRSIALKIFEHPYSPTGMLTPPTHEWSHHVLNSLFFMCLQSFILSGFEFTAKAIKLSGVNTTPKFMFLYVWFRNANIQKRNIFLSNIKLKWFLSIAVLKQTSDPGRKWIVLLGTYLIVSNYNNKIVFCLYYWK